jgi:citrate lyase subunit beta/citryl-CoA lyase
MYVRINALNTPYAKEDIAALGSKNIVGLMLPKVESPDDLIAFGRLLTDLEKDSGLIEGSLEVLSICETAKGLEEIYSIASAKTEPNRDMIIAFGAADFTLDLGISLTREGRELDYARTRLPIASKAAGIGPPLDTPWMVDLKDVNGLVADAQKAKAYGFQGKIVIHPTQIQPCHDVFTPTQAEIDYARKIVEAFEAAERDGKAAIQLDGRFIDYPVVERARRTIELSRVIEDQG